MIVSVQRYHWMTLVDQHHKKKDNDKLFFFLIIFFKIMDNETKMMAQVFMELVLLL
jgi:hypothetical protein